MKISVVSDGNLTYTGSVEAIPGALSSSFSQTLANVTDSLNSSDPSAYYDIFKEAANTYKVNINLLMSMAKQESDFDPNAVSSSGAMGLMQLMPETAEDLGVENPFDPYQNIMGGAKYIAEKLAMYGGDVSLALAAYNAGSGAVEQYGGIPPYEETQNYVSNILAYMQSGIFTAIGDSTASSSAADTDTNLASNIAAEGYVSSTAEIENNDITNPADMTKEQVAKKLEELLADFSNHESFDEFVELFNQEIAASESVNNSSDAYDAYAKLGAANRAIQTMLQNKQENNV